MLGKEGWNDKARILLYSLYISLYTTIFYLKCVTIPFYNWDMICIQQNGQKVTTWIRGFWQLCQMNIWLLPQIKYTKVPACFFPINLFLPQSLCLFSATITAQVAALCNRNMLTALRGKCVLWVSRFHVDITGSKFADSRWMVGKVREGYVLHLSFLSRW